MAERRYQCLVWFGYFVFLIVSSRETNARTYAKYIKTTNTPIFGFPQFNTKYDNEDSVYVDEENTVFDENDVTYENEPQEERRQNYEYNYNVNGKYFKEGGEPDNSDVLQYGFMDQNIEDKTDKFLVNHDPVGLPFVSLDGQNLDQPIPINAGLLQSNHVERQYEEVKELTDCDNPEDWIYYCGKMSDGHYFDPWNPWCGYILCRRQRSYRKHCRPGTWMGLSNAFKFSTKDMCKTKLPPSLSVSPGDACPKTTDYQICKHTSGSGDTYEKKTRLRSATVEDKDETDSTMV